MPASTLGSRSQKSINTLNITTASSRRSNKRWRRPLLQDAFCIDLQKGSYLVAIYCLFMGFFCFCHSIFDTYCLTEASPGATHYGYYIISFDFVYAGNRHVRRILIIQSVISLILSLPIMVTSCMMLAGLRKEQETRLWPWLFSMFAFTLWRIFSLVFGSIVNDLMFGYHVFILIIWLMIIPTNIFCWLVVFSNYQELSDITRLEDMAKLKMGTMSSLNALHSTHSISGSRPPSGMGSHPPTPSQKGSGHTQIA